MALICPNKNLKEWKDLESSVGEDRAMIMWYESEGSVGYSLKASEILNSDKAKEIFEKGRKAGWNLNKILTELAIPKEQKQIILDLGITENKANVIIPIGTSGSGKSTFIKSLPQENLVVIEPDAMRVEFTGDMNNKSKDKEIYEEAAKRAVQAIKQGKQVVFDTTNLTKDKRLSFIEAIKKEIPNANIQYKLMELNPELAKQRIKADIAAGKNRANVPDATIDRHAESYKQMLEDIKSEPISEFKNTDLREQLALELASKYSYTVEINTAKDDNLSQVFSNGKHTVLDNKYQPLAFFDTKKEADDYIKNYDIDTPTQHYSNLTVPGGTNYTENEIGIPGQLVQEKPQGISTKPGVQELFNSNPELANIGTPQQYSQYLDTIFPDSKVKDIVYHGSSQFGFDKFSKEKLGEFTGSGSAKLGFFFSNSLENSFSAYTRNVQKDTSFDDEGNLDGLEGSFSLNQINSLIEDLGTGKTFTDNEIRFKEFYVKSVSKSGGVSIGIPFKTKKEALENYKNDDWNSVEDKFEIIDDIIYGKYNYSKVDWLKDEPVKYYKEDLKNNKKVSISFEEYEKALIKQKNYLLVERENLIKRDSKNRVYNIFLDVKNLKEFDDKGNSWREETYVDRIKQTLDENKDGLVIKNTYDPLLNDVYVVFEPEQIHILGSKQDIEGFKGFVKSNTKTVRKGAITPSIKGHAQFSTDNGIGWFRSDEQTQNGTLVEYDDDKNQRTIQESRGGTPTKTRRILEVQSDLFQKGRDKEKLAINKGFKGDIDIAEEDGKFKVGYKHEDFVNYGLTYEDYLKTEKVFNTRKEAEEYLKELNKESSNQFLQLLNKDNNWVTFFIKSIIQDSAKKGYEKVLFPKGETASKIEGHETLANEIIKIDTLIQNEKSTPYKLKSGTYKFYTDKEQFLIIKPFNAVQSAAIADNLNDAKLGFVKLISIANAKQIIANENITSEAYGFNEDKVEELEKKKSELKSQGIEKLKPIYAFYENKVTNILKKQFGSKVKDFTDEYGNTWNEVTLDEKNLKEILFNKKSQPVKLKDSLVNKLTSKDAYGKQYIRKVDGSDTEFRVLKNWKSKGLEIVRKLESEYPGVITHKTVNNEVLISINPQMGLKFGYESRAGFGEVQSEEILRPILDKLKDRFQLEYEFVNDDSLDWAGEYDGDVVKINLAKATLDTPFHEFAHPFIRIIRNKNRVLYNKLVKEIYSSKEGKIILDEIRKKYPELSENDQIEEAIVTAIGMYAEKSITNTSLVARITDFLKEILSMLGITSVNPRDLSNMTIEELGALMASDVEINISEAKGFMNAGETSKSKKEPIKKSAFEQQAVFFKRRISKLEKELKSYQEGSNDYESRNAKLKELKSKLEEAIKEQSQEMFLELGKWALSEAEKYIDVVTRIPSKANKDNLLYAINILESFYEFPGLETDSKALFRRAFPIIMAHNLRTINYFKTETNFDITEEMINEQVKDIGSFRASVGALADLSSYIGRTIGSIIKAAHNRASKQNKQYRNEVQDHVDKLIEYAKSIGKTLDEVYDMMIIETEKDLKLIPSMIKIHEEWVENKEFNKIKESKVLLDFYNFYQKSLINAEANLSYKIGKHHIPNIHKTNIKYKLTHLLDSHNITYDKFKSNEDLYADIVPEQFRNKIPKENKSRDLGASLLEFVAYSNIHSQLSEALPEARLLQEQLKWSQNENGQIELREFTKSSQSDTRIYAKDTNLYKMIDTVIDMQLKGRMTHKQGEIKRKETKDEEGNVTGYKASYWSDVVDLGLKYNSMLRIGFSPVTAIANVLFGDISNIIEAVGGRYFGVKDLAVATNIFHSGVFKKDSNLNKYLEALNPLQELDDYNIAKGVQLKKMTPEKLQEYMYGMQKQGELFLQSRTMLAIMLKSGLIDSRGELTNEGKKIFGGEINGETILPNERALDQLSDKVQRVNQLIHGRYSAREAAAMQQSVFYRAAIQFRKWIPAAIEGRLGDRQYDNRLGMEIEGRYRTLARIVGSKEVFNNLLKMAKGELSELEMYNMKKNLAEITILVASLLAYMALAGGDDDEGKKRRKNPLVKAGLTLVNRISGDLLFFYSPSTISDLGKNAIPLAKTVGDLIRTIEYLPAAFYAGEWEYEKGNLKGSNKFWANLRKNLILAKPLQDVYKIMNKNPLDY